MPNAFTRHLEFRRELFERQGLVGELSRFENATFAVIQHVDRGGQRIELAFLLVLVDDDGLWRGRRINEMILPFTGFSIIMNRCIDRFIAAEPTIHIDDILVRDGEVLCNQSNLVWVQVAALQCRDLVFRGAQLEKELLLVGRRADLHK